MVLASFKNRVDLLSSVPKWIFSPTLSNYPAVFIDKEYWPLAINSVLISVSSTLLCILIGAPAAYGFARSDFPEMCQRHGKADRAVDAHVERR